MDAISFELNFDFRPSDAIRIDYNNQIGFDRRTYIDENHDHHQDFFVDHVMVEHGNLYLVHNHRSRSFSIPLPRFVQQWISISTYTEGGVVRIRCGTKANHHGVSNDENEKFFQKTK